MHNLRSEGELPHVWTTLPGNGTLPQVWIAPQHMATNPYNDNYDQILGFREDKDDQNHHMDTVEFEVFNSWTSEWSCLRIPKKGIKPYVVWGIGTLEY